MTDDFDELASAYLDGEATAEESARVESDPELRAHVDALRSISGQLSSENLPFDPTVRSRHLDQALGAFDQLMAEAGPDALDEGPEATGVGPGGAAQVVDLAASRTGSRSTGSRSRRRGRLAVMPSWLAAAAVAVVLAGGLAWAASRQSSQNETSTAAFNAASAASTTSNALTAGGAGVDAAADQAGRAQAPAAANGASATTAAGQSTLAAGTNAADAVPKAAEAGPASTVPELGGASTVAAQPTTAAGPSTTVSGSTTSAPAGQPPLVFAQVPSQQELTQRATAGALSPASRSTCGPRVAPPANATLAGFVPVVVAGQPGEALVYSAAGSGQKIVVLVDADCTSFS